jgi:hypothetical protein
MCNGLPSFHLRSSPHLDFFIKQGASSQVGLTAATEAPQPRAKPTNLGCVPFGFRLQENMHACGPKMVKINVFCYCG